VLVEQYCESIYSLCPGDHALIYASSYFPKHHLGKLSFLFKLFYLSKYTPRYIFETKLLSNLSIYKIIWIYKVEWSNYFTNFYFVDIYKRISKHLWEYFTKEMFMSPFVSKTIYQSLTPSFETLLYLTMAWSLSTGSIIVSDNARLSAHNWPCVVSWLCVTIWLWWVACV
jgi:hypothetical protein